MRRRTRVHINELPIDLRPHRIRKYKPVGNLGEFDTDRAISRGMEYDTSETLPIDLMPFEPSVRQGLRVAGSPGGMLDSDSLLQKIADDTGIIASTSILDRGLVGTSVTVDTTPTLIIRSVFNRGYIILNPSTIVGTTSTGTILASASRATTGNTQATALSVSNYRDLHLFLDVTAVPGAGATLDIFSQALDPVSAKYADIQNIFPAITATGTYYANIGSLGLVTDFAIRWAISAGNFTFSIGFALKEGLPGTSNGLSKTIYLGNSGVSTVSGFPILEGQSRSFYARENTELWAVASAELDLRIFEL